MEESVALDSQLFEQLVTVPGISGREERIRSVVQESIEDLVDEVRVDRLGNLIGVRKGDGPRVMVCAHMDTIGFLVSHIEDEGFLRILPVGGYDARTLYIQQVLVQGKKDYVGLLCPAVKPIHLQEKDDQKKGVQMDQLFVDIMVPADEVKENVSVGDAISLYRRPVFTDRAVTAPYLDDRLGVYVVIELLRRLKTAAAEIHAVFSVQEEVGVRGAKTSAFDIQPDIGIAVDVTIANDIAGAEGSQRGAPLGEGVAIGVMDSLSISDPRLVKNFGKLMDESGFPHQREVFIGGGTDAGAIQLSRAGVPAITISVPTRYVHTVNEMALVSDIETTIEALVKFLSNGSDLKLDW
jgi:tetrahedral aminopeptidase